MKTLLLMMIAGMALGEVSVLADDPVVPAAGFPATRYEALWKKSPFAVETSEAAVETSPDYSLVGFANIEGVQYASLIDAHNSNHLLVSSDKPVEGLTLTSITVGKNGGDTYAVVNKNGQALTLRLQQVAAVPGMPGVPPANVPMPGAMTPQIPMPGANNPAANHFAPPRFHRPPIHLPPRADQQQAAPAPTPAPQ